MRIVKETAVFFLFFRLFQLRARIRATGGRGRSTFVFEPIRRRNGTIIRDDVSTIRRAVSVRRRITIMKKRIRGRACILFNVGRLSSLSARATTNSGNRAGDYLARLPNGRRDVRRKRGRPTGHFVLTCHVITRLC